MIVIDVLTRPKGTTVVEKKKNRTFIMRSVPNKSIKNHTVDVFPLYLFNLFPKFFTTKTVFVRL